MEYFLADRRNQDGLGACCRECDRARLRQHQATPEAQDRRLRYEQDHRQHINQRTAQYRAIHTGAIRQSYLTWAERNPLRLLLRRAQVRARVQGLVCTLTEAELEVLWTPECPVLGRPYDLSLEGPLDDSPSLDRLDPAGPYRSGNVAIVSTRANRLKNNGTAEEHRRIGERMQAMPSVAELPLTPVERQAIRRILSHARARARRRGVDFQIEVPHVLSFPQRCPYLGLVLGRNRERPGDDSRSLDRIDPRLGYVPGNVELVSLRANRLKGDGTAEEHLRIAEWMGHLASPVGGRF